MWGLLGSSNMCLQMPPVEQSIGQVRQSGFRNVLYP